jgi:hypothetical protein
MARRAQLQRNAQRASEAQARKVHGCVLRLGIALGSGAFRAEGTLPCFGDPSHTVAVRFAFGREGGMVPLF